MTDEREQPVLAEVPDEPIEGAEDLPEDVRDGDVSAADETDG